MKTLTQDIEEARAVAMLRALANPIRFRIVRILAQQQACVCGELVSELPVAQSTVSEHLKVLKDAGLVIDRPLGTRRIYQLDPDGVGALRAQLDRFWSQALTAYKPVVEQPPEEVA